MRHAFIVSVTSAMLAASPVWAREGSAGQASSCVAEPVFHCVQHLKGGGAIGHFGYRLRCPDEAEAATELFIDIGDDNLFSPGREDRGQPKVFLAGEHVDEFEAEFSLAEAEAGTAIQWSVMDQTATVDFSRSKDRFLDCSVLP